MDLIKLHEQVLYPTVRVRTPSAGGSGTVIYSKMAKGKSNIFETYVLTNCHVIDDAIKIEKKWNSLLGRELKTDIKSEVSVEFFDFEYASWESGQFATKADIVEYDKDMDIGLLKLKRTKKANYVAKMFPKDEEKERLKMFQKLYAVGCALGHPPVPTEGHIAGFTDIIDNYPYYLSTAPTIFGNSGGSVYLQETLEFVGIPSRIGVAITGFSASPITHMSYFIPITSIYKFIDKNLLYFLYDDKYTSEMCEELRKKKRKEDEKELLISDSKDEGESKDGERENI